MSRKRGKSYYKTWNRRGFLTPPRQRDKFVPPIRIEALTVGVLSRKYACLSSFLQRDDYFLRLQPFDFLDAVIVLIIRIDGIYAFMKHSRGIIGVNEIYIVCFKYI